jgi:hypothetical protein
VAASGSLPSGREARVPSSRGESRWSLPGAPRRNTHPPARRGPRVERELHRAVDARRRVVRHHRRGRVRPDGHTRGDRRRQRHPAASGMPKPPGCSSRSTARERADKRRSRRLRRRGAVQPRTERRGSRRRERRGRCAARRATTTPSSASGSTPRAPASCLRAATAPAPVRDVSEPVPPVPPAWMRSPRPQPSRLRRQAPRRRRIWARAVTVQARAGALHARPRARPPNEVIGNAALVVTLDGEIPEIAHIGGDPADRLGRPP